MQVENSTFELAPDIPSNGQPVISVFELSDAPLVLWDYLSVRWKVFEGFSSSIIQPVNVNTKRCGEC